MPVGTVFGLLGPNGAGKTTLIGADGWEIRVAGHDLARDPQELRAAIGVTGQFSAVDKPLTGRENLQLIRGSAMSTLSQTLADSTTMLRRNLLHAQRYPSLTVGVIAVPGAGRAPLPRAGPAA